MKNISNKRRSGSRLAFIFYLFGFMFLIIIGQLVVIQVVKAADYREAAVVSRMREKQKLMPERGGVYDRNGTPLALSLPAYSLHLQVDKISRRRRAAVKIAEILGLKPAAVLKEMRSPTRFYLATKISKAKVNKLKAAKIKGLMFDKVSKRFYPAGALAPHVIGFVDVDNVGKYGVEAYYNKLLRGKSGWLRQEEDNLGRPIPGGKFYYTPPVNGDNIILTIDKEIQYKAQVELKNTVKEFKADGGTIIVMNPKTGAVYAMANAPGFDLNHYNEVDDMSVFNNAAVSSRYEPGSTMKVVTAAAALTKNLFHLDDTFVLPPEVVIDGWTFHDSHKRGTEVFTFKSIITKSSNIGALTIAKKIGKQGLYSFIQRFGLTRATGIDLPNESSGYVDNYKLWSDSKLATVSFGQGISATPIEMATALAAVADKGVMVEPRVVKRIIKPNGKSLEVVTKAEKRRIMPAATASRLVDILKGVVETGTGRGAAIPGYKVAGKTGTARKPDVEKGGYSSSYVASFDGFVPADNPALLVLVAIDSPRTTHYGSQVAVPAFKRVTEFALQRLKILPEKQN